MERTTRPALMRPPRTRHRLLRIGLISAIAVAGVVLLGGLVSLSPTSGLDCPKLGARVTLDPGHGGEDPGAGNDAAGLIVRDMVLEIAQRTTGLLESAGYSVALTRSDNATGYANTPRGIIANACHSFVYVSIHLNSFGEPEPNYVRTYWGIESKDTAFAMVMQTALAAELRPGTNLGDSGLEQLENGGLLTARMPAALIEPLFMSNPEEAARLADPNGTRRDDIAAAMATGIDVWLRSQRLGPIDVGGTQPGFAMTPQDRVLAPPRGSAVQALAVAFAAEANRPDQVWSYVSEVYRLAPRVGLDPAIIVAQSALETGWWRSPAWTDHLNPAGIGITGPDAVSPTWESGADAARAQIVHLYLYAAGPIPAGHLLAPYIPLDPRYAAALAAERAGSAPHIADLAGRWATDPNYADSIARVGHQLFRER